MNCCFALKTPTIFECVKTILAIIDYHLNLTPRSRDIMRIIWLTNHSYKSINFDFFASGF